MKKIILGLVSFLFFCTLQVAHAADLALNINFSGEPFRQLSVMIEGFRYPSEVAPIILTNPDGKKIYVSPGGMSHLCLSQSNILQSNVILPQNNCLINATVPSIFEGMTPTSLTWKNPASVTAVPWKYSYDGIFGASVLPSENRIFFAKYFEAQNFVYRYPSGTRDCNDPTKSWIYQGPFHEDIQANYCTCDQQAINCSDPNNINGQNPVCVGGNNKCPADQSDPDHHDHSYPSMASGITMGWADYSSQNGYQLGEVHDEGPIIWPQDGYRVKGKNAYRDPGYGLPIVKDDYLYLFYVMPKSGQAQCVGVSRSKITDKGLPGTWKNYYNGSFSENSLPPGFDKSRIRDFYEIGGGKSDCILQDELHDAATWFSVSHIKNTDYFIAAEETSPNYSAYKMGIRFSKDLIHWSPMQIIDQASTAWGQGNYTYARFINKEGNSNSEVDPHEFYLYGKKVGNNSAGLNGGYIINSLKLSLIIKPPVDKIDLIIRQYFKEILGRDVPNPSAWHQNVMNQSGCTGVIKSLISSTEFSNGRKQSTSNEEYIKLLYGGILSRGRVSTEIQWHLEKLNNGTFTRDSVVDDILNTPEATTVCAEGKLLLSIKIPGDFDGDNDVDLTDFGIWKNKYLAGTETLANFAIWKKEYLK